MRGRCSQSTLRPRPRPRPRPRDPSLLTPVSQNRVMVSEADPMRCKPEKPALHERPLLTREQAGGLMTVFKVLANDTRLRLLHALARAGELCVTDLAAVVDMKPQAVS